MKMSIKRSLLLALPVLLAAAMLVSSALAGGSMVHDAEGDSSSPPYTDIVAAKVTEHEQKETLSFKMELAGAVPAAPSEAVQLWVFHVDTAPGNVGTPSLYNEYIVRVRWAGGAFDAHLVNRITGVATAIAFSIDGTTVKAWVPLALLGNPTSFGWNAATRPSTAVPYTDFAPDGGVALATWTQ